MHTRLFASFALCLGLLLAPTACTTLIDPNTVSIQIRQPTAETQVTGFALVEIDSNQTREIKELLIGLRSQKENKLLKILHRTQPDRFPYLYEWDTTADLDGPYEIFVQVLLTGQTVAQKAVAPVWIVNGQARLRFKECQQGALILRDQVKLTLEWLDTPPNLPPTPVELYVQGIAQSRLEGPPYIFDVDLSALPHATETTLSAVVLRGLYRGTTSLCTAYIDRQGPKLQFLFPDANTQTVPLQFTALLEIQEDFGLNKIEILATAQGQPPIVVGTRNAPPFQISVDLSAFQHQQAITLQAVGTDNVGNITPAPPSLQVTLDAKPPTIEILSPQPNAPHLGRIRFEARARDEAGLASVAFYLEDEKGQRLDNLLFQKAPITSDTFQAEVQAAISLYGPGERRFVVIATDQHQNQTTQRLTFLIGCLRDADCPAQNPPYQCRGNRCLIPEKLGGPCDYDFSCEGDLLCTRRGITWCAKEKLGICRQSCLSRNDCPNGYFCLIDGGKGVCFPGDPCSPFTANCASNEQCAPWGKDSFVCLPVGGGSEGSPCTPLSCDASKGCQRGYACLSSGNSGVCKRLCDQDYPSRDCTNRSCVTFPLRDGQTNKIGYCR